MKSLLAVDLGVRSGFAVYGEDGRLLRYWSQNFGSASRLRRAVPGVLAGQGDGLCWLIAEGSRSLGQIWQRSAEKLDLQVRVIGAETWRRRLLLDRHQRSGEEAKRWADRLARKVIRWSDAPRPTSLRHDAAEAILIGLWGALELGWLVSLPSELRP